MAKIEEKQHPSIYLKLARTFLSLGDDDLSRKTCERGLSRFPFDSSLHTQRGCSLISLYNKKRKKEFLLQAITSFEKSITINPDNYLALMLSAKIYLRGKAYNKAKEKLGMILASFPGDPKATELSKLISDKEKGINRELAGEEEQQAELELNDEIEHREEQVSVNYDLLTSNLSFFRGIQGFEMLFLVDKYGMIIKSMTVSKVDSGPYGIAVSNVFRSSQNAIRRTGLGIFSNGLLITPENNIYIVDVKGTILVIVTLPDADNKTIEKRVEYYLKEIESRWTSQKS